MKFAIFREIIKDGKKKRKVYVEWDKDRIIEELQRELDVHWDFRVAEKIPELFNNVIEKFKKESIKIP
jgi:hypothetical protein